MSAVLTVYNLSECLNETLTSLERQSYSPKELLIIDDGSTDGSENIIKSYLAKNPNWKFIKTANNGVSRARNIGLRQSTGDYIIFLDGDDIFHSDFFLYMMEATEGKPQIVVCRSKEMDDVSKLSIPLWWSIRKRYLPKNKLFNTEELSGSIFYTFMGWPWDKLFLREHLVSNELYFPDLNNSEDLVLVYAALVFSNRISIVDRELIYHRVNRKTSISMNVNKDPLCVLRAIKLLKSILLTRKECYKREEQSFTEWSCDLALWGARQIQSPKDCHIKGYQEQIMNVLPLISSVRKPLFFPVLDRRIKSFINSRRNRDNDLLYAFAFCKKFGVKRLLFRLFSSIFLKIRF